jgi:tetratricopeptide (TPR) repeat protein
MTERPLRPSLLDLRAPLVGRGEELSLLEAAMERVRTERTTQIVSLLGPQGAGKSRLVHEFLTRLQRSEQGMPRMYRGSARGISAAYGLFSRMLRDRFGLLEGMDEETTRAWVRSQVASVLEDRKVGDVLYFLGQLLELPFPDSPLTRAVADDPVQGRLLRRAVLRRLIEADAASGPVALVLEDLDALVDDSLVLLAFLLSNLAGPILIICISRAELQFESEPLLSLGGDRHRRLELSPLDEREAATVIEALLAPCGEPPPQLVDAACAMAGGNPMLLERMVRIYHDTGVLEEQRGQGGGRDVRWVVHLDRLATVKLPLTIEDAVEARIAALEPAERLVLERAAAMGSVFWLGGLLALDRMDAPAPEIWRPGADGDGRLRATLDALVERDYVLSLPDSTFAGDEEFVFKHNKERERIARTTSAADLRRYHQVIAEWLEHKTQVRSHEEHMGMVARHRELAGGQVRAALSYLEAGDVARSRYANQKAAEYYARGLDLLADADAGRRIQANHNYGDVLLHLGRQEDGLAQFREMLRLAFRLDLITKGGAAHNRIGRLYRDTGRLDEAARHLEAGLALFRQGGDERGIASSVDDLGKLSWLKGDYPKALDHLERALEMRRDLGDRRSIALSLNNLGLVLQDSGRFRDARDAFEQSLSIRREIGDLLGVVTSLNNAGSVAQDQGDHGRAMSLFQEAHGVAREVGDKNRIALVLTNIGETHYRLGRPDEAVRILKQAEELCDELGDKLGLAEAERGLGKAYMLQGDMTRARACISRSVELFTAVKSKVHLGIALRTLGEVTAAGGWGEGHTQKARDYYLRAMAIFQEIGNEIEVARTAQACADFLRKAIASQPAAGSAQQRGGASPVPKSGQIELSPTMLQMMRVEAAQMEERASAIFERLKATNGPTDA